jgi:ribosomal protein L30/L7E
VPKVPETLLKTAKVCCDVVLHSASVILDWLQVRETQRERSAKAQAENIKRLKTKRQVIFQRAEKYVSQYRKIAADKVRVAKLAKKNGQVYVPPEAKVLFVIRVRGINGISPKPRKVLQLFRLRQINNGVFIKVNKATMHMLRLIEPYVTYGYVACVLNCVLTCVGVIVERYTSQRICGCVSNRRDSDFPLESSRRVVCDAPATRGCTLKQSLTRLLACAWMNACFVC